MRRQIDHSLLEMALIGYEAERRKIEEKIGEIRRELGVRSNRGAAPAAEGEIPKPKHKMSAAAKKRIAAAQKKRWAAFHAKKAEKPAAAKKTATKKAAPRKAMSADVKQKRIAALAKARAAKAAKRAARQPAA